ncbi:hypothetical protein ASPSYDRAFT_73911 [Aspergillus sydowii CBS 593.65]|uniref:Uncharacterized protein n=1 Tax=Aspergillus sydowii CBS 593.65 TaxID=1036612 RepID=A0A1L9SYP3_9EURO|nr:uncharacterized protein ASPSYDRAFT_73911 [Aspergillus sydowii CBS 593.65]OJJ52298.1 hypothetical protein ASPSYDRAFT_73911 [Aspergillus sydowii CBS 593.65]
MGWTEWLSCLYIRGGDQESESPYPGSYHWRCERGLESKTPGPTNSLPHPPIISSHHSRAHNLSWVRLMDGPDVRECGVPRTVSSPLNHTSPMDNSEPLHDLPENATELSSGNSDSRIDTSAHAKIPLDGVPRRIGRGGCRPVRTDSAPVQATPNPTAIAGAKLLLSRLTEPDLIPPDVVIGTFNRNTEEVMFERPPCRSVGIAGYSGSTSLRHHALRVHGPLPPSAHGDIKVMFFKADSKAWRVLVDIPYMYAKSRIPQLPDPSELSKVDDKWLFIGYTTSPRSPSELGSEREDEADGKQNSIGGRSILALPSPRPSLEK